MVFSHVSVFLWIVCCDCACLCAGEAGRQTGRVMGRRPGVAGAADGRCGYRHRCASAQHNVLLMLPLLMQIRQLSTRPESARAYCWRQADNEFCVQEVIAYKTRLLPAGWSQVRCML